MTLNIIDTPTEKRIVSDDYSLYFSKKTGFTARWGRTEDDDPTCAPIVEIADIEISTGKCLGNCLYCYKSNGNNNQYTSHMTLENFKTVVKKLGPGLNQVALGLTDIYANPDFFAILKWCNDIGIVVNYTCHGLDVDDNAVYLTSKYCGAVAVSIVNKTKTYNAVKKFTDAGMTQVNIHYVLGNKSVDNGEVFDIITDIKQDARLSKLNALVLLAFKDKANTGLDTPITDPNKYKKILEFADSMGVHLGLDSCSGPKYLQSIKGSNNEDKKREYVETCCAGRFSAYINALGIYYPCSFMEQVDNMGWSTGINVLECEDFYQEIWNHHRVIQWRNHTIQCGENKCPCKYFD